MAASSSANRNWASQDACKRMKEPENLSKIKVMTLNDAMDPAARMFFYGTLLTVCKLSVKFETLLQPSGNVDQLWSMEGYASCLQNMEELVNFDPSRTTFQIPSEVLHFESARNLRVNMLNFLSIKKQHLLKKIKVFRFYVYFHFVFSYFLYTYNH